MVHGCDVPQVLVVVLSFLMLVRLVQTWMGI